MNKTVILVGNPNVGKSVIFNRLTGRYAVVSNYPGTTVDISRGVAVMAGTTVQVIDTPGTNSLLPLSEDEQVTRDVVFREKPDVVIQVADAKNLSRALMLTMELLETGLPLVLALNMTDEAIDRGIRNDRERLSALLGIPVVETVGTTGEGIGELKKQIFNARSGTFRVRYSGEVETLLASVDRQLPGTVCCRRLLVSMLVSGDAGAWAYAPEGAKMTMGPRAEETAARFAQPPRFLIFNRRTMSVNEILGEVQSVTPPSGSTWLAKLGALSMRPFPGYPLVLLVLFVMYEFVGVFAAGTLVDLLEGTLFGRYVNPFVTGFIERSVGIPLVRDFLVGEYGLITMALTYALGIILPIVSAFFLFFGILEDSGYLPRLSVMLDRVFRVIGLNGKAVLPMILGLGCGTMATISTRILETKKERLLVMLLLALTIPCSAQLGVILGLLSGLTWKAAFLWVLSLIVSMTLVGAVASRILPGSQSPFVLEIPPLRVPSLRNILQKVWMRLVWYLEEAVPLFALGTAVLFAVDQLHLMQVIEGAARPLVTGLLGLPSRVTEMFILGFLRRDYGAAGLFDLARQGLLSPRQVLVSAVAVTLFVPCIAQCFMVVRERGWKTSVLIFAFVIAYAFLFSGLLNFIIIHTGIL